MRRIAIVFSERDDKSLSEDGGQVFEVFLEGHDPERLRKLPMDQLSAAELWALQCFRMVIRSLRVSGASQGET